MIRKISFAILFLVIAWTTGANATSITSGWGIYGFSDDINVSTTFDSQTDVKIIWAYDNQNQAWSAYSPNSTTSAEINNNGISSLSNISMGNGVWILSDAGLTIGGEVNSSVGSGDEGVLVDPYIAGAILCEDVNKNNLCDTNEQVSSTTTSDGMFTFSSALTPGSNVIIKTQGQHEGGLYDLNISAVVASDGTVDVVSPLTTFETRGLTPSQIAEIFNLVATNESIASFSVSGSTILDDPLANGLKDKTMSQLTAADLNNIQSSLASYGLLRIMEGSTALQALSGNELYVSGTTADGTGAVYEIAKVILKQITAAINIENLTQINSTVDGIKTSVTSAAGQTIADMIPLPTIDILFGVATSVVDRLALVGYTTCNATSGDPITKVTAALGSVATAANTILGSTPEAQVSSLMTYGMNFYGIKFNSQLSSITGASSFFPTDVQTGLSAATAGNTSFRFDSSNTFNGI